jgi:ubiquinone/menaquinone biosynthesis C-methylase UbiE
LPPACIPLPEEPRCRSLLTSMSSCMTRGIVVLHPGGLAKTDGMALACHIAAGQRVLDIGVGRVASACFLAPKYDCHVKGIDVSERMVEASRRRAKREGLEGSAKFVVADACSMPFEDGSFDVVIAECVTTPVDKPRALDEMIRVARTGAYVGDLEMTWR